MVTLHHFTHPQWFEDQGGWAVVGGEGVKVELLCNGSWQKAS